MNIGCMKYELWYGDMEHDVSLLPSVHSEFSKYLSKTNEVEEESTVK